MQIVNKIKNSIYVRHETKWSALKRFLIIVSIFLAYFIFVSIKYGISNGIVVSILTWTFFVFGTPIADAGFLVDFPVRLLTKMRMIHSEMIVWTVATSVNLYFLLFSPQIYQKTALLHILRQVLIHPYPYWSIIIISASGTFLSVYFGDELLDVAKHSERKKYIAHRKKYKFIIIAFLFLLSFFVYKALAKKLGIEL